jgi:hypothetical protein
MNSNLLDAFPPTDLLNRLLMALDVLLHIMY